jgi:hypothetical protein
VKEDILVKDRRVLQKSVRIKTALLGDVDADVG